MTENFKLSKSQMLEELQRLRAENSALKDAQNFVQSTLENRTYNVTELSRLIQDGIQQRVQIETELTLHRNILIAVAEIAQNFLLARGWEELVEIALEQLEQAACVSRVYLFKNHTGSDGQLLCSQLFEKCAETITPQIDNEDCQNLNWHESGLGHWYDALSLGEAITVKHSTYSQKESEMLDAQQVLSILIVPLFIKGHFWGFMGFDDCVHERDWSDAEIASLKSATIVIGGAMEREQSEQALRENEELRLLHAEKQKDELVREVHHRIKNHLQGLMGLLRHRKKEEIDNNTIIDEAISQIESVAIVYGLQASHSNAQIYFSQMLKAIIHSAASLSPITLSITYGQESGSCEVDRSKAVALALVINEMMMNAIKHFHSENKNEKIKVHHEHQLESIILSVSNPGTLPEGFDLQAGKGLGTGLELARSMLPSKGAKLLLEEKNNEVVASLLISSPLLVDI